MSEYTKPKTSPTSRVRTEPMTAEEEGVAKMMDDGMSGAAVAEALGCTLGRGRYLCRKVEDKRYVANKKQNMIDLARKAGLLKSKEGVTS